MRPVSDVYRALADPTRRAILDELTERDGQTLFELCSRLATKHGMGSTRQGISQHGDILEAGGLGGRGPASFELCPRLATKPGMGSTRQAISQHVDILEAAGLVRTRREGRYKFHHLDTAQLREIAHRWPMPDEG